MHRMDANPCACESSRSQLSHAQGFRSKSPTVASEYSFEIINILEISGNSTKMTAISSEKLKGESDQMTSFMGEKVPCMGTNLCALEKPRPQLLHAQGFMSKSLFVASEYSIENALFSEIFSPTFEKFIPKNNNFHTIRNN